MKEQIYILISEVIVILVILLPLIYAIILTNIHSRRQKRKAIAGIISIFSYNEKLLTMEEGSDWSRYSQGEEIIIFITNKRIIVSPKSSVLKVYYEEPLERVCYRLEKRDRLAYKLFLGEENFAFGNKKAKRLIGVLEAALDEISYVNTKIGSTGGNQAGVGNYYFSKKRKIKFTYEESFYQNILNNKKEFSAYLITSLIFAIFYVLLIYACLLYASSV